MKFVWTESMSEGVGPGGKQGLWGHTWCLVEVSFLCMHTVEILGNNEFESYPGVTLYMFFF